MGYFAGSRGLFCGTCICVFHPSARASRCPRSKASISAMTCSPKIKSSGNKEETPTSKNHQQKKPRGLKKVKRQAGTVPVPVPSSSQTASSTAHGSARGKVISKNKTLTKDKSQGEKKKGDLARALILPRQLHCVGVVARVGDLPLQRAREDVGALGEVENAAGACMSHARSGAAHRNMRTKVTQLITYLQLTGICALKSLNSSPICSSPEYAH